MTRNELIDQYFDWMYQLVVDNRYSKSYRKLFARLHDTEFTYTIPMDGNRAEDGIDLRYRFGREYSYPDAMIASYLDDRPCSILEMMTALAIRCEEHIMDDPDIGNRTGQWFWSMLVNLGLGSMYDAKFDRYRVDRILERLLDREYGRNGKGGLFTVNNGRDMRTTEIWYQMNYYLSEVIREDQFHMLDEELIFANTKTGKRDYASKSLSYPLEPGETPAWEKLISTLYSPEERHKIEWCIGSIVTGASKRLQKFMVFYGAVGTGKSNKSFERNLAEASKWPATYAEVSKSGCGIHLHYIYSGDVTRLSRIYDDHIEIKVFTGNSSLRRKLSKCNNLPIATISSGLPLKGENNVVNAKVVQSEKGLRLQIKRNLNKEIHPATKPSIDFIYKILTDAYESGMTYDVTDMRNAVLAFAANSSNQAEYCIKLVNKMPFKSAEDGPGAKNDEAKLVFYDVEVFPNLFLVNWKIEGPNQPVVRMINPKPQEIEELMKFRLVGFNCRRYDNHILYGERLRKPAV